MSTYSIEAWYLGQKVYLGLPYNSLVFDGQQFVRPQDAKFVALVNPTVVGPVTVPGPWPETNTLNQAELTWSNLILAQVLNVTSPPVSGTDVIGITDPNNGACVCAVSCSGTDLQYVQVSALPGTVIQSAPVPTVPGLLHGNISPGSLPPDPLPPSIDDVVIQLPGGHTIRAHQLTSIGGVNIGLLITGTT